MTIAARDGDPGPLLAAAEVVQLQREMEAGLLARDARLAGRRPAGATEVELRLLEERGEQARQRFIQANLGLVWMITRQFGRRVSLPESDLFQEGCVGLITAVERFDHQRGNRFSTYALFWVRAYISAATARQLGAMNLPTSRAARLREAHGVESALVQQLGRLPTVAEVAVALGRDTGWTSELLAHQRPQSLESVEAVELAHLQEELAPAVDDFVVRGLLRRLDPLGRQVLELRLGFVCDKPCSFSETARHLAISVSKARRVEARALEELRSICPQQAVERLG